MENELAICTPDERGAARQAGEHPERKRQGTLGRDAVRLRERLNTARGECPCRRGIGSKPKSKDQIGVIRLRRHAVCRRRDRRLRSTVPGPSRAPGIGPETNGLAAQAGGELVRLDIRCRSPSRQRARRGARRAREAQHATARVPTRRYAAGTQADSTTRPTTSRHAADGESRGGLANRGWISRSSDARQAETGART